MRKHFSDIQTLVKRNMDCSHILLVFSVLWMPVSADAVKQYSQLYRDNLLRLTSLIEKDINACDDFFQHACGFDAGGPDDAHLPSFLYNQQDRMEFFEQHKAQFGTRVGQMLRELYVNCKQRNAYDVFRGSAQPQWTRMLQELNFLKVDASAYTHWPFLQHQWELLQPQHNLSWVKLAAQLAAQGVPTLLRTFFAERSIYIQPNDNNVSCPSLEQYGDSLQAFLSPTRHAQIAGVIANELWMLCRQLRGELYVMENNDNLILTEYIGKIFTLLHFSEQEVAAASKITIDGRRLNEIFNVLRATEPRIVFNYVLWQAYDQLKYEDCYQLTEEFEQLLFAEYWQWHVFKPYFDRSVAMARFLLQTTRFTQKRKNALLDMPWDQFLLDEVQHKDFNLQRAIVNYVRVHLNAKQLDEIYAKIHKQEDGFYAQLLAMRRVQLQSSFYRPLIDAEDHNQPAYFLRKFLYFSILVLKQPLYHYFATEGYALWYDANLQRSSDGFYTALDCLVQQTLQQQDSSPLIYRTLTEDEVRDIYRFYYSFVEAHRDYEFWLQAESFAFAEDFVLELFKQNSSQIMFYAVAQLHCGRNNLRFRPLINRSYMSMTAFQRAFNCSDDAIMNPTQKCMLK